MREIVGSLKNINKIDKSLARQSKKENANYQYQDETGYDYRCCKYQKNNKRILQTILHT